MYFPIVSYNCDVIINVDEPRINNADYYTSVSKNVYCANTDDDLFPDVTTRFKIVILTCFTIFSCVTCNTLTCVFVVPIFTGSSVLTRVRRASTGILLNDNDNIKTMDHNSMMYLQYIIKRLKTTELQNITLFQSTKDTKNDEKQSFKMLLCIRGSNLFGLTFFVDISKFENVPSSQLVPVYPVAHWHVYSLTPSSHVPPF